MSEVIVPKSRGGPMAGIKRDHQGREKSEAKSAARDKPRNAYTSMFESFRDELEESQARRMKIGTVSRDVTALSKKIIFSLQRVRDLGKPIPERIQAEVDQRLHEIAKLLATIEPDLSGMNRYRYPPMCLEELVEALSFAHYLRHQALITPAQAQDAMPVAGIPLTAADYVFGVFDLTGEMMRFATAVTALAGAVPTGEGSQGRGPPTAAAADDKRTIVNDMQEVSSMFHICPPVGGKPSNYAKKMDVMVEQVLKVERLGYGVTVRGTERPKGWMPDLKEPQRDGDVE
ncbi:Translin [Biscogniauxia mediterranea]|nr:Translin [Biscogniauxia mediterranea]